MRSFNENPAEASFGGIFLDAEPVRPLYSVNTIMDLQMSNYAEIIKHSLDRLYASMPVDLAQRLPAEQDGKNYIFRADDEFPASVTCLFSRNAANFLPTDALADTGEYTSKKIIDILSLL